MSDRSHDPGLLTIASAFTSACQTLLYLTVLYVTAQCTGHYSDNKATTISSIPFQTPQGGGWEETTHSLTATHSRKTYTLVFLSTILTLLILESEVKPPSAAQAA